MSTAPGVVAGVSVDRGRTWRRVVVPGLTRCTGGVGPPAWAPNPHACFATSAAKSRRNAAAYRPEPAERHGAGSPPTGPPALSTPNEPAEPGG